VYGYSFLLVFPLLAGLWLSETTHLRRTVLAYTVNDAVGLLCYLVFVAYGPRNYMPDLVQPLLYDAIPRFQLLTSEVNANTNVFPSLHTSLSVTVILFAWRTRDPYPRWLAIAAVIGVSVVISTMYLGIHWGTDVVAGTVLAVVSFEIGTRGVDRWHRIVKTPAVTNQLRHRFGRSREDR
jgi:membrane-associated phospholipid phosphatase